MVSDQKRTIDVTAAWDMFECRVAALMSSIPEGGEFTLYAPSDDRGLDDFTVQAEAGCVDPKVVSQAWGTSYMAHDDDPDRVLARCHETAGMVVEVIREECGLPHPDLLTVSAPAELADRIGILRLARRADVGPDHNDTVANDEAVSWPTGADELRSVLLTHLQERFGPEVEADEDGDVLLVLNDVRVWVRVAPDQPAILLGSMMMDGVEHRKRADTELNVLNRSSCWVRWIRRDDTVGQELAIPARPFSPSQFDGMLALFVDAARTTRPDLIDRLDVRTDR